MKSAVRLLSSAFLVVAIGAGAYGGASGDLPSHTKAGDRSGQEPALILAGGNGHDTVGGLMPLPLWPPAALGVRGPATSPKRKSRSCCGITHHAVRAQQ